MTIYNEPAISAAATSARWAALTKIDVDVATIATWDPRLPRDKRILVPIDVQALVVPTAGAEGTVAISGTDAEPEPFAAGAPRAAGVHLHWAMPDALLRGRSADRASGLTLPALPDRWAVIRTLLPEGGRLVHVRGWVIDARTGSVTELADWTGTPGPPAATTPTYTHLDGASGGTLLWSATYTGALNRFALHDDLADLPSLAPIAPSGFHGGRAVYTVAGWWSEAGADPLAGCRSRGELTDTLHAYGWYVSPEAPDTDDQPEDPRLEQLQTRVLKQPATSTPTYEIDRYHTSVTRYSELAPATDVPVAEMTARFIGVAATHYHSLLHGSVLGVPITGEITAADDRPASADTTTAIGLDLDDVTAALAAPGFGTTPDKRQSAERLMAAFTSGLLARIGTVDGIRDIQEQEHADGFWAFAGAPLPGAKADRLRAEDSLKYGPTQVGRKGRGARADALSALQADILSTDISWSGKFITIAGGASIAATKTSRARTPSPAPEPIATPGQSRTVAKPAPRMFRPAPAIVAVRGLRPNARHHGDSLFDPQGLRCRWPGECQPGMQGVVDAAAILPTLGNGAIPSEVLQVVREAVTLDPYSGGWLAQAGAPQPTWTARETRIRAEHVRLFGTQVVYDGSGANALVSGLKPLTQAAAKSAWGALSIDTTNAATDLAVQLANFSLISGAPPSPVAITTWRQPWVPLFIEWRVRMRGSDSLTGWQLDELDLTAPLPPAPSVDRTFVGRSPITTGIAKSLSDAMEGWLNAENARDAATPSQSQLDEAGEAALAALRNLIRPLDLVSCSLDGVREQLLGIDYLNGMVRRQAPADDPGGDPRPVASALPIPLFGGQLEVVELRAVDAFGRVLPIPVDTMRTTSTLEVPGAAATIALSPRVQHGARWLFRFVDPSYPLSGDPMSAPEAYVDQVAGADAVTPICGYLLPDHMDESLEVFDRFGKPIGELVHDAISDAVRWEPAPGRPVPPESGPLTGIPGEFGAHAQHVGLLASGLIERDVESRHSGEPATRSALSALLRAIDTTLWTIDTFAAIGSPTIAGLVGRPVAVVRATLRLDAPDDIADLTITEGGGAAARRAAFDAMSEQRFPVRIGDLGRSDDAVLGFFVDDDYRRFHVVDKVVASSAFDTGRHRWHLGLLGETATPAPDAISHPYLEAEDTLYLRPGQVMRLTILMLPAGKVHVTTGIVPRKALALPDDWTAAGLQAMVPSLRVGPVLVDPAEIKMPKIASLPKDQNFIRRTGPLTWKEDPIIAATSAALLPKLPHEAQEGWVRVAPAQPPAGESAGTS